MEETLRIFIDNEGNSSVHCYYHITRKHQLSNFKSDKIYFQTGFNLLNAHNIS